MRSTAVFILTVLLLSCSTSPVMKQEAAPAAVAPASPVTMLENTAVVYDRSAVEEVTMEGTSEDLPKVITKVNPTYPPSALGDRLAGNVSVQILIAPTGQVRSAKILKTDGEIFNQPSLEAALKWTFEPPMLNGKSVAMWVSLPFAYRVSQTH